MILIAFQEKVLSLDPDPCCDLPSRFHIGLVLEFHCPVQSETGISILPPPHCYSSQHQLILAEGHFSAEKFGSIFLAYKLENFAQLLRVPQLYTYQY